MTLLHSFHWLVVEDHRSQYPEEDQRDLQERARKKQYWVHEREVPQEESQCISLSYPPLTLRWPLRWLSNVPLMPSPPKSVSVSPTSYVLCLLTPYSSSTRSSPSRCWIKSMLNAMRLLNLRRKSTRSWTQSSLLPSPRPTKVASFSSL